MTNRKIEALQEAAAHKAKESAERVEKALERMIKQGQVISFKSVAQTANVSTAYLYKQEDLRNRIETLRDQQKQRPKSKQAPLASDNSKSVIISTLREENKKLRAEIDGLRRINEGLAGRVYHLQGADDLAERFKVENTELKKQLDECRPQTSLAPPKDDPKVTSGEFKYQDSTFVKQVEKELLLLDISFNETFNKQIESKPESVVINAIEALKEAIDEGTKIDNLSKWLYAAIKKESEPNKKPKPTSNYHIVTDNFNNRQSTIEEELASPEELKVLSSIFGQPND